MKELRVKIKTLTPLWTGGVDGTMDRIHETGILGSLRWWYEALVRGLGGEACDPTSDGKSGTSKRCPDDNGHYCDVCAVFGATGLRRAFRLEGPAWWNAEHHNRLTVKVNQHRRHRGWYLGRGYLGEGELALRALRLPENWQTDDLWQTLYFALRLISCWAGIGAKSQQGYGVVQTEADKFALDIDRAFGVVEDLKNRSHRRGIVSSNCLPAIDQFFFVKVRLLFHNESPQEWLNQTAQLELNDEVEWYFQKNSITSVLPLAPVVRYYLRALIREHIKHNGKPNAPARWHLMGVINGLWHSPDYGKIQEINKWYCPVCNSEWNRRPSRSEHRNCGGRLKKKAHCLNCSHEWASLHDAMSDGSTRKVERQRSLINVSHAYPVNDGQWEFRIWGWIPNHLPDVSRATVLEKLQKWLGVQQSRERQWHDTATNQNTLWNKIGLNEVQVCWFSKQMAEDTVDFLKALPTNCDTEPTEGSASAGGRA